MFSQIIGQEDIKARLIQDAENGRIAHAILFSGPSGCGKTTIAEATRKMVSIPSFHFNASTDNKDILKQIINDARFNENTIIVIDEIHRMKKDIQDFSGGQKKKVLIAKSISEQANIYIWDEPLNYIDILTREQIEEAILNYKKGILKKYRRIENGNKVEG